MLSAGSDEPNQDADVQFSAFNELINILVITGWDVCLVLNTGGNCNPMLD
jgi:hypothetical protein